MSTETQGHAPVSENRLSEAKKAELLARLDASIMPGADTSGDTLSPDLAQDLLDRLDNATGDPDQPDSHTDPNPGSPDLPTNPTGTEAVNTKKPNDENPWMFGLDHRQLRAANDEIRNYATRETTADTPNAELERNRKSSDIKSSLDAAREELAKQRLAIRSESLFYSASKREKALKAAQNSYAYARNKYVSDLLSTSSTDDAEDLKALTIVANAREDGYLAFMEVSESIDKNSKAWWERGLDKFTKTADKLNMSKNQRRVAAIGMTAVGVAGVIGVGLFGGGAVAAGVAGATLAGSKKMIKNERDRLNGSDRELAVRQNGTLQTMDLDKYDTLASSLESNDSDSKQYENTSNKFTLGRSAKARDTYTSREVTDATRAESNEKRKNGLKASAMGAVAFMGAAGAFKYFPDLFSHTNAGEHIGSAFNAVTDRIQDTADAIGQYWTEQVRGIDVSADASLDGGSDAAPASEPASVEYSINTNEHAAHSGSYESSYDYDGASENSGSVETSLSENEQLYHEFAGQNVEITIGDHGNSVWDEVEYLVEQAHPEMSHTEQVHLIDAIKDQAVEQYGNRGNDELDLVHAGNRFTIEIPS